MSIAYLLIAEVLLVVFFLFFFVPVLLVSKFAAVAKSG
jgi:hypothetical protein